MAFSLRKMLSNINYFKKPEDDENNEPPSSTLKKRRHTSYVPNDDALNNLEPSEPDSTSKNNLQLPDSVKKYVAKKSSFSDTEINVNLNELTEKTEVRKCKKLRLDINKANQSAIERLEDSSSSGNVENTPKHVLLECRDPVFFKGFDLNISDEILDAMSESTPTEENLDIESLSDNSDSDVSILTEESGLIQMCRKVEQDADSSDNKIVPSSSPDSFVDVEFENDEDERVNLLLNYQMKLEKLESILKKMLKEFQFHIEVSKIFKSATYRSMSRTLPDTRAEVTFVDDQRQRLNKTDMWNMVSGRQKATKSNLKKQLVSMKGALENFIDTYFQGDEQNGFGGMYEKSLIYEFKKEKRLIHRFLRVNKKKRSKHFEFPDLREAMVNLFCSESEKHEMASVQNLTNLLNDNDEADMSKCVCHCRCHRSPSTQTDSGLTNKTNDRSISSQSISSSIGNFSLDATVLTAYSESLDLIVSYNSFQDSSLYGTLLQKAAIERITFYIQVHSIQIRCEQADKSFDCKNVITFFCPTCKTIDSDENSLLKHILSSNHCEKIHFVYKTAYIKKCMSAGKEIQPSTVLNPMTMYRDDNKIVCFGDAMYACSLCFENLIIGESVLMAHCSEQEHVERREKLSEILSE